MADGEWQSTWGWWGAAGREPGNADTGCRTWEVASYLCVPMSWLQDEGDGLCRGGTVSPEHSRDTGMFGGREGMSHSLLSCWVVWAAPSSQSQRARKHHSSEMWNLGPVSKRVVYSWVLEGKQPKFRLPPASRLCGIIWCLKTEQWQPWHSWTPQAQAEQCCTMHRSHVLKAAVCERKTVRSQDFLCLSSLSLLPPETVPFLAC